MSPNMRERISVSDTKNTAPKPEESRPAPIELIDVYDENRELTGVILPRGTFLRPGQFQLYALAMIVDAEGRFLITQRSRNESWGAGWWEIPGGGVPAGETSAFAIVREVREETGLDVSGCRPELLYSYTNVDPVRGHNYFTDIWRFTCDFSLADVVLQEEESVDARLACWDDICELAAQGIFLHFERLRQALGK